MEKSLKSRGWLHFLLTVVLPVGVILLAANLFLHNPPSDKPAEQVASALGAGLPGRAERLLEKMVQKDPTNIELQRSLIRVHYMQSDYNYTTRKSRDDQSIRDRYEGYITSDNPQLKDIGHYGLGLIEANEGNYQKAISDYVQVSNRNLKYLNNSIGYCLMRNGMLELAKKMFVREIQLKGNVGGAYRNLIVLARRQGDFGEMRRLIDGPAAAYAPPSAIRELALHDGSIWKYVSAVTRQSVSGTNIPGFVGALLILLIWLWFFHRLDVFEPEKPLYLAAVLLLGMLFAVGCHFLYDLYRFGLKFSLSGNLLNDFLFCVFGIGLIEETVKILPLFLMMWLSRQVDEAIDYVVYGAVSALGFAFMENLIYFGESSLTAIHARAFSAVILHISLTALATYGLVLTHRRHKGRLYRLKWFGATFGAAILLHGLYDFFLISRVFWMTPIAFLLLLFMMGVCQRVIINGLNKSQFWDTGPKIQFIRLVQYLKYALVLVVLYEYLVLAWKFGPRNATSHLAGTIIISLIMISVISQSMGLLPLHKGLQVPLYNWKGLFRKSTEQNGQTDDAK
jgi:protease PrsW